MEQERKIEKLLKAYAKKRRDQTGDSFKLDPATRQMLQSEISRNAPAAEDEDETMSLWELFRKNWLYLMGFAACVFVVAALLLPSMYAPVNRAFQASSTSKLAKRSEKIGMTNSNANVAALTPAPPLPAAISGRPLVQPPAPASASDNLEVAPGGIAGAQPKITGPATSHEAVPPAAPEPSIQTATGIPAAAPGSLAMNSMPANAPQTQLPRREASRNFGGGAGGFAPVPAAQRSYQEAAASPSQSAAVLVNFQVSQNGNTIRVVDQDGSIYTGSVHAEGYEKDVAPMTVSSWAAPAAQNNMPAQNANSAKTESPKAAQFDTFGGNANRGNNASPPPAGLSGMSPANAESPAVNAQSPVQKYVFYAAGTNQTLKQSIVFAGTLMEDLSLAADTQQSFGMSANAALGAAFAQQFVRSALTNQPVRIQGVAIIDQTFKIQINATSVPAKNSSPLKSLK